jgi:hypothetical protein
MNNSGVKDVRMMEMCGSNYPLKAIFFLQMCLRGQIQSAAQLIARN